MTTPENVIKEITTGASNQTFSCNSPNCKMEKVKLVPITSFDDRNLHYEQTRTGFTAVTDSGEILHYAHYHTGKYQRIMKSKEKTKNNANKGKTSKKSEKHEESPTEEVYLEEVFIPLVNPQTRTGQIVLPESPEGCDSIAEILTEIENKIVNWIYISPEEIPIFRVQLRVAVASWFLFVYDNIKIMERVAGLLSIVGTSGGGKKRWLTVMRQVAYRPIYLLNTNKIPSVFRMAEPWGTPTLLIDEADQKETGSEAEWVQFVNSRYDGTPTPRFNTSSNQVDTFKSFGLTCLALRRMPRDEGTTSRMVKINATISPVPLPEVAGEDIFNEFESVRNKLLYLRLKYYSKLKFVGSSGLPAEQSWRGKETLTLFRILEQIDPKISEDITKISAALTAKEVENLSGTWDGLVLNEIYAFISDEAAEARSRARSLYFVRTYEGKDGTEHTVVLNLKYLAERLDASASEIARSLAAFKITTFDRFRVDGLKQPQRGVLTFRFPEDTDRIMVRYVPKYDHRLLQSQLSLDSENFLKDSMESVAGPENERLHVESRPDASGKENPPMSNGSVPHVPDVPPHDISTDLFLNNNNNHSDTHAGGTSGTTGTDSNKITPGAYNSESSADIAQTSVQHETESDVSSFTLENGSTNIDLKKSPKMRDSDHAAELNADPVKSDVPEQKRDHDGKIKNDQFDIPEETLRNEIINIIIDKAPLTEFNTLTPKAIHDLLCVKLPGISLSAIYRICKEEYDKGTLSKHGPGYRYNGGDF